MELLLAATKDDWAENIGWIVMVAGGTAIALIAIITDAWRKASETKAKEESRREIAAYVAEGSMTAEDAAQILGVKLKGKKTAEIDRSKPPAS